MPKKYTVLVNDELDERFRNMVFKVKGLHRGSLTQAVEEALELWISYQNTKQKVEEKV